MPRPEPTPIYRLVHRDNLVTLLQRQALHAPNHTPADRRSYRVIHNREIQNERMQRPIPCGPGGVMHDYVPFYFGPRSPMLLQLHTGRVEGYAEGQEPLIYLVSTVQHVVALGSSFVFSDGHGIAGYTRWFDTLDRLDQVDWPIVASRRWYDTPSEPDRQRRKQAEFLIHRECPWNRVLEVGVLSEAAKAAVEGILSAFDEGLRPPVRIRAGWYY